ncbi:MAG: oligoendopeptidase F [Phycisphaerales bacterium]|nr:MAG: oligoendopeptidase F [Phycisphaerales bacterium]
MTPSTPSTGTSTTSTTASVGRTSFGSAKPTGLVPADLDASRWENVQPLFEALQSRPVDGVEALERWLADRSELEAACSEAQANLYIAMTCDTASQAKKDAYVRFLEEVAPRLKPARFELDRRQVELVDRLGLSGARYEVLDRDVRADVALFREENVPIQTQIDKVEQGYTETVGAMTVHFDGQERTLPQMAGYLQETDRSVRERAWRAIAERRLQDAEKIDGIYDELIALRHQMARNAGCESYVQYAFRSMHRFDYTPEDCQAFHRAVEEVVVPFKRRLDDRRREKLGVEPLRPWDLAVDPLGRAPLRPFDGGADLVAKTARALASLDGRLAEMFASLGDGRNDQGPADGAMLDLDSRKGKGPGGYQYMRDRSRRPFIFMNAAGLHRDVETMVHEAGHAFHSMLCRDEPLLHYRHSPIEFAEVASMSMELLTMPHWGGPDGFYPDPADHARAMREQLEGSVAMLAWIATIDAFQHLVYGQPEHTRQQRTQWWLELDERFGHQVSWDGLERERQTQWQRQLHLFSHPFYYIEYGIAQLGALQLWVRSLDEGPKAAIDAYLHALSLGGSRPLPELFEAAGIRLDFSAQTIARLAERVEAELAKLPE